MNKKIITGAAIAFAAGLIAYFYNKNKSSINCWAEDTFDAAIDAVDKIKIKAEDAIA